MGLISFIKEAGHKLGFGKAEAAQPEGSPSPETPSADAILAQIKAQGIDIPDLKVEVEGDKVKVSGNAPDQATKEKAILAAGNVAGVAAVEEQVTAGAAAAAATFYTVKKGDTLSAIAKAHYGAASKYPVIFEANKPMLKDPDKIYPGQVLRIPAAAA